MSKATLCLWYDGEAEEAARFYAATFPETTITAVHGAPGKAMVVELTLLGLPCIALNGGPMYRHSPAISFQIATDTQAETDRYWQAITGNGGKESQCGWCEDRWGLSFQIIPRLLTRGLSDPNAAVRACTMQAMRTMKNIDIAAIEAAIETGRAA